MSKYSQLAEQARAAVRARRARKADELRWFNEQLGDLQDLEEAQPAPRTDLEFLDTLPDANPVKRVEHNPQRDAGESLQWAEEEAAIRAALDELDFDEEDSEGASATGTDGKVAEGQGGKVAENGTAQNTAIGQENKGLDGHRVEGCPVETPHTPLSTPSHTPTCTPSAAPSRSPSAPPDAAPEKKQESTPEAAPSALVDPLLRSLVHEKLSELKPRRESRSKSLATRAKNEKERSEPPTTRWKVATREEKFRYSGHAAQQAGGVAFTLNLSPEQEQRLREHPTPARAFTDRLNTSMREEGLFSTPYSFVFEVSPTGRLHLHGLALVPKEAKKALKRALRAAGGTISGRAGSRQVTFKEPYAGARWASYSMKKLEQVQDVLSGDVHPFLSRQMTRMAQEFSHSCRNMLDAASGV